MASYENNSLTLGSSATLSQNLVIKSNTDGTFSMTRQDNTLFANYANDSAAATGGVPIGGLYRNGSVLMVRSA